MHFRKMFAYVISVGALAYTFVRVRSMGFQGDFASYWAATLAASHGDSPYNPANLTTAFASATGVERYIYPYLYPPPFLALTYGFAHLPSYDVARMTWLGLHVAFACILAWRLAYWSGVQGHVCLVGVLCFSPTYQSLTAGQIDLPLAVLILEGVMRGWPAAIALAATMKVFPAAASAVFLLRGEWAKLARFMSVLCGLLLIGLIVAPPHAYSEFAALLKRVAHGDYLWNVPALDFHGNHSISRILVTWSDSPTALSPALNTLRNGILVGLCTIAAWRSRRARLGDLDMLGSAGAMGCALVLGAPTAWSTYLVLCLPALAYTYAQSTSKRERRVAFATYIALALPDDWWQPITYLLPELTPLFGAIKLLVIAWLYVICVRHTTRRS